MFIKNVRLPCVANLFYPGNSKELGEMIEGFLNKVPSFNFSGVPKALIVPHAGYVFSGFVAASAYALLKNRSYQRVILLGPSHYYSFSGGALSEADFWKTPFGEVPIWHPKETKPPFFFSEIIHQNEHSLEVQLPWLQVVLKNFEILPILLGDSDVEKISESLAPFFDQKSLLIISSDFSHYHPYQVAKEKDELAMKWIEELKIKLFEEAEACGKNPILVGLLLAKKFKWKIKKICYQNSGDVTSDKAAVVGYGSFVFYE